MNKITTLEPSKNYLNSSDVVNKLNITASSLRTYTSHFRRFGYSFLKKNGRILYSTYDVELFQKMIHLHETEFGTITDCIKHVLNVQDEFINTENTQNIHNTQNKHNKQAKQLKHTHTSTDTENEIARIKQELEELRKYVDESIKKRDELLLQTLREVLESKQKKKKKWWQFWK
ncbi:hypothetical protein M3215_11920 [Bacillus cytotoxicus]|uniref:Uncharacterized protein n=1 Tax=Bacillus cytotoxicus TaxID=580165 RepID=A0ACC6A737_9BACI|nr:hypothetical protein [Bacillus cytotoxicus]